MKLNYKTYWRKTGLKGKWGNIYLERISYHKPKYFLEIGVFCGVTARNTCDLLYKININNFTYTGIDLFGGDKSSSADEIEPKFLLNQKFSNPLKNIYYNLILRENLNNIKERGANHFFCRGDVFDWLKQFNRKGRKFGLVILDPPSFSRSGKSGSFSVINDYSSLVELAADLVEPFGWILACSNHRKLTNNKFISSIKEGVKNAKRKIIDIELSQMPFDFSGEKYLKSVWVKLS